MICRTEIQAKELISHLFFLTTLTIFILFTNLQLGGTQRR